MKQRRITNCKICGYKLFKFGETWFDCNHINKRDHFYKVIYTKSILTIETFVLYDEKFRYSIDLSFANTKSTYLNIHSIGKYKPGITINGIIKLENYNRDYIINKIKTIMLLK